MKASSDGLAAAAYRTGSTSAAVGLALGGKDGKVGP
jgi:hypothetical protein